ncbi:hypothetical protein EGR_06360 [Echinococcus granulosus]|uniref:Uncharacterized protein n=1 Tax=Echinococcus granulosus TaxID=6210 RepID=W6UDC3_ECHGR|nr:hypothetical protein EGR_06360 [Echinococcus granulosus]EUB58811.1 hypothetical protein EGR_06360 [Echinococcus granulosus]
MIRLPPVEINAQADPGWGTPSTDRILKTAGWFDDLGPIPLA